MEHDEQEKREQEKREQEKREQEKRDKENQPQDDWHSLFFALLMIILSKFGNVSRLDREVTMGAMPPRADFVFTLDDLTVDLQLAIFKKLKKFNIFEFKSPGDDLGIAELWQTVIYLAARLRDATLKGEGTPGDFTITLFREGKPVKLLRDLKSYVTKDDVKGIYHINNYFSVGGVNIPIQIVVCRELPGPEYAGFRAISKSPKLKDVKAMADAATQETDPLAKAYYSNYFKLLSLVDPETVARAKRRYRDMATTLWDIMKPEVDKYVDQHDLQNLYTYVQKGGMSANFAASELNLSVPDFLAGMKAAGFKPPANANVVLV